MLQQDLTEHADSFHSIIVKNRDVDQKATHHELADELT